MTVTCGVSGCTEAASTLSLRDGPSVRTATRCPGQVVDR